MWRWTNLPTNLSTKETSRKSSWWYTPVLYRVKTNTKNRRKAAAKCEQRISPTDYLLHNHADNEERNLFSCLRDLTQHKVDKVAKNVLKKYAEEDAFKKHAHCEDEHHHNTVRPKLYFVKNVQIKYNNENARSYEPIDQITNYILELLIYGRCTCYYYDNYHAKQTKCIATINN